MRTIHLALLALFCFLLTGCGSLPSDIGRELASVHRNALAREDAQSAKLVQATRGVVSMRTPSLSNMPKTLAALQSACAQGQFVEVIAYAGAAPQAASLKGSCVPVYLSDNPDVGRGEAVLMLDSNRLVVQGELASQNLNKVRQEYAFRNYVKSSAVRFN